MGQPVVHFEVIGKDGERLQRYYSEMFGWEINSNNPVGYGIIEREQNLGENGIGIGGGIMGVAEVEPYSTFYVAVPDVEAALKKAEELGGARKMGPMQPMEGIEVGLFEDPEGNLVGVVNGEGSAS